MNEKLTSERDETSIRLTLEGDREAFGQLVRKYQDRLFNGMVQILRSEPEAEDVVQEAFVLALTKLESFQGKSRIEKSNLGQQLRSLRRCFGTN